MAMVKTTTPQAHHYARTVTAGILGTLAMVLISASILVVWVDRTLTDTTTYVQTVGPVIARPELQDFVATKVTEQLLDSAPVGDLAAQLLPADQVAGKTPEQLRVLLEQVIHDGVVQILRAPHLQEVWQHTNRTAHAELVQQLDAGSAQISLDLGPLVDAAMTEMKQTKLAPLAQHLELKPSAARVGLAGAPLERIHQGYKLLKAGTPLIVLVTLLLVALNVWASVHHAKTLRRMLTSTGVSALLLAGLIAAPGLVQVPGADPMATQLAAALVGTLLHGLQVACGALGLACIAAAVGYKLYDRAHGRG